MKDSEIVVLVAQLKYGSYLVTYADASEEELSKEEFLRRFYS